jgi:hypothetical protein
MTPRRFALIAGLAGVLAVLQGRATTGVFAGCQNGR